MRILPALSAVSFCLLLTPATAKTSGMLGAEAPAPFNIDTATTDTDGSFILSRRGGRDDGGHGRRGGRDDDDHGHGHGNGHRSGGHGADGSSDDDVSGSGRRRPRVPGGSGCDDANDIREHAECS